MKKLSVLVVCSATGYAPDYNEFQKLPKIFQTDTVLKNLKK